MEFNMEKLLKESIEMTALSSRETDDKLFKPVVWYSLGTKALELV